VKRRAVVGRDGAELCNEQHLHIDVDTLGRCVRCGKPTSKPKARVTYDPDSERAKNRIAIGRPTDADELAAHPLTRDDDDGRPFAAQPEVDLDWIMGHAR